MSDDMSIGSFTKFGSPSENVFIVQCGSPFDKMGGGGLKGFSRSCSEVGVETK